jgi:arsenate reductase
MAEAGVDISAQWSKHLDKLSHLEFDFVITLCDDAQQNCPVFPGRARVIHREFDDPPRLAAGVQDEERVMEQYRRVRDELRAFVEGLLQFLPVLDSRPETY